jgi:hypothetical protein
MAGYPEAIAKRRREKFENKETKTPSGTRKTLSTFVF